MTRVERAKLSVSGSNRCVDGYDLHPSKIRDNRRHHYNILLLKQNFLGSWRVKLLNGGNPAFDWPKIRKKKRGFRLPHIE